MLWTLKKFIPLPEFEPQFLGHAAHSPDATMTDLSRLPSSLLLPKKFIPLPEFEPQFPGHAAHSPDATMTDLSRLPSSLSLPSVQHSPSWIVNSGSLSQEISQSFGNIH